MKNIVVVDAAKFRAAMDLAVVERKSTIPVLQYILLRPVNGALQLVSTNLDLSVITDLDGLAENETEFLLPWRKVLDVLKSETGPLTLTWKPIVTTRKISPVEDETDLDAIKAADTLPDDTELPYIEVTHEENTGWVALEVGGCVYDMPTMGMRNFPQVPDAAPAMYHVNGPELKATLQRVTMAISREESRYTLNGALVRTMAGKLTIVGTDGHRLAVQQSYCESAPDTQTIVEFITRRATGTATIVASTAKSPSGFLR